MHSLLRATVVAAALLLNLSVLACQTGSLGGRAMDPAQLTVGSGEVPGDLQRCPASGSIDRYLAELKPKDQEAFQALQDSWLELKKEGANSAAIALFATGQA